MARICNSSDSPWPAQAVFEQIQAEIRKRPELEGGMLTLDESGDKCSGPQKAGAARQYLGRLGKVDLGQVGATTNFTCPKAGSAMITPNCADAGIYPKTAPSGPSHR